MQHHRHRTHRRPHLQSAQIKVRKPNSKFLSSKPRTKLSPINIQHHIPRPLTPRIHQNPKLTTTKLTNQPTTLNTTMDRLRRHTPYLPDPIPPGLRRERPKHAGQKQKRTNTTSQRQPTTPTNTPKRDNTRAGSIFTHPPHHRPIPPPPSPQSKVREPTTRTPLPKTGETHQRGYDLHPTGGPEPRPSPYPVAPSSNRLGHDPFKVAIRVRVPLGSFPLGKPNGGFGGNQ